MQMQGMLNPVNKIFTQRMDKMGYTDASLAKEVECDRSMITKIRLGTASPSLALSIRIGSLLNMRSEDMAAPKKDVAE